MSFGVSLPYYKIVSPTVTVTMAAGTTNANKTFNTNTPFGKAMNVRRIRPMIAIKNAMAIAGVTDQFIWELTEDSTKTTVSQTDPFALSTGGIEIDNVNATSVGFTEIVRPLFTDVQDFLPPHPGVPTVAQQLNVVGSGIRVVGADTQSFDLFLELYYELIDLSENIKTFLSNRIVLQRTT